MLEKITLFFRFLLCLAGAAALLYAFSYPDTLLPPNPILEDATGFSLYKLKPIIWVLPVLFMELVAGCGPRRNLVWFGALGSVLVVALLAYPLLSAHWPEYVRPTFSYQGGMLATGLTHYLSFLAISLAFRMVLLTYIFPPEELQEQVEVGYVAATALNPEQARTLKEIAADKRVQQHKFHFKSGDSHIALRWRLIMRQMMLKSRIANASAAAALVALAAWFFCYPQPTEEEALQRDMKRMFEHRLNAKGQPLATTAAVHAAARVMKHISDYETLSGMSREEAETWLELDKVPQGYRDWLRDERDIKLASVNNLYENRTRFLTVTNGRQICVLYIRTNEADQSIVISELQDAGWDAVADENRRRIGNDWGALYR
jgi:hypothetical protein